MLMLDTHLGLKSSVSDSKTICFNGNDENVHSRFHLRGPTRWLRCGSWNDNVWCKCRVIWVYLGQLLLGHFETRRLWTARICSGSRVKGGQTGQGLHRAQFLRETESLWVRRVLVSARPLCGQGNMCAWGGGGHCGRGDSKCEQQAGWVRAPAENGMHSAGYERQSLLARRCSKQRMRIWIIE